jgi:2-C-methyl-D-erythritol 4-phosphate cytidylyltransferase
MGAERPKQYLPLAGRPLIVHALERLLGHPRVRGVAVAVAPDDPWWPGLELPALGKPILRAEGGGERCHSVLAALEALAERAHAEDWVLVHDAVRPCLRAQAIERLLAAVDEPGVRGALLAVPVRDTLKRAGPDGRVVATVDREGLWQAQTPQIFPLGALRTALAQAIAAGIRPTDEADAMERSGVSPLLVPGDADNLKITAPGDLELAALHLARRA